ncbi:putative pentatricopeptide repeat-containing protein At3g18840 isoform X2 [Jatropha curcas]|uniref:putative pentatricopeptide repeat-containing protein At3g18840 isoform X2 n=1 Tax=Jatropha curcas TaxID=180498 RepID=UPI0009D6D2DD|nr:putative pentatricopeptide repeat-containing protein At3g18840 isoform X2 [Jatropha curcas]
MKSLKDGLRYQVCSIKAGFTLPIFTSNQLIHLYSKHGHTREAQKLFDQMPDRNVFSWNAIISAHIKTQNLKQAKVVFDSASVRDLVTYNSMLSGYVSADGYESSALELFIEMQTDCYNIGMDEFTLTTMVNLFAKLSMPSYGRQVHSYMVKTANDKSGFAMSSLIDMYSKCGCFQAATEVFKGCEGVADLVSKNAMVAACCREGEMDRALKLFWRDKELNDTVSWNILISGYAQNGYEEESLKFFLYMMQNDVKGNEHTFASLLSACAGLRNLKLGKEIHAWVLKNGLTSNPFINSGVVDVYCKCGNMNYAESTHLASRIGSSFSITSMIVGYASQGKMVEARRLFDSLTEKNAIVWTALFSGYLRLQQCEAVFELFNEYRAKEIVVPDGLILVSLLGACALQAALSPGKQIHGYVFRMRIAMDEKMSTAMVDMYSKCGSITYAEKFFQKDMLEKGVRPNVATFIALLSACRHCGLVDLGEKLFNSMTDEYNIPPEIDHYTCMIDLYGRANQLEKAVLLMKKIPIEQEDATILGAFLNACILNRNAELAKEVEDKLLKIEGDNGARYVQLANIYAAGGNWSEMGRIRKKMRGKEIKKVAGCSWLYLENGAHVFTSGDRTHRKAYSIYSMLACLNAELYEVSEAL